MGEIRELSLPWERQVQTVQTLFPQLEEYARRNIQALLETLSLQRSSWGSVTSPPTSQNLQTNGAIQPSFDLLDSNSIMQIPALSLATQSKGNSVCLFFLLVTDFIPEEMSPAEDRSEGCYSTVCLVLNAVNRRLQPKALV